MSLKPGRLGRPGIAALVLVAGVASVSVTGQSAAAGPRAAPKTATAAKTGHMVRLSVHLSKRKVHPGRSARLRVRVRNLGELPLRDVKVTLRSSNPRVDLRTRSFHLKRLGPSVTAFRAVAVLIRRRARGRVWLSAGAWGEFERRRIAVIDSGPCQDPVVSRRLLCPDLQVARPSELYLDKGTRPGRALLRATNDIESRGAGPIELRGRRDRPRSMNVTQAIRRRSGGYKLFPTQARLRFFNVGSEYGGSYWKVRNPLRLELWRIDPQGRKARLVRVGPKQFYCFRDLERTSPGPRSPASPVYPACNQNPETRKVTLGTSVGWSDIYPSTYDLQWINVTGLKGCFAYVQRVDPFNLFFESKEKNNTSQRIVRLPYRGDGARGCRR